MEELANSQLTALERMTRVAFDFGPFFFAVVFLFVIIRVTHGRLAAAETQAAKGVPVDMATHRWIYWGSCAFAGGLILVTVAVWLYGFVAKAVAEFSVAGLKEHELLASDTTHHFFRLSPQVTPDQPVEKTYHFAAVVEGRFGDPGISQIAYWNEREGKGAVFDVPNRLDGRVRYRIEGSGVDGWRLVTAAAHRGLLVAPAHADDAPSVVIQGRPLELPPSAEPRAETAPGSEADRRPEREDYERGMQLFEQRRVLDLLKSGRLQQQTPPPR